MLTLKNIAKQYSNGTKNIEVLKNINLHIQEGDFLALMGPSGSGKSTLMNIIGCLDTPTTGEYFINNQLVSTLPEDTLAEIRNKNIGFVFQQFHLLPRYTALENVALPLQYAGIPAKQREEMSLAVLEKMGLADRVSHKPNQLSGGQMQRVAIARALVNNPSVILADEPTGNLDSNTSVEIMNLFKDLNQQGKTVVLVTHEDDIARYAKKIIHLKDGMIVN